MTSAELLLKQGRRTTGRARVRAGGYDTTAPSETAKIIANDTSPLKTATHFVGALSTFIGGVGMTPDMNTRLLEGIQGMEAAQHEASVSAFTYSLETAANIIPPQFMLEKVTQMVNSYQDSVDEGWVNTPNDVVRRAAKATGLDATKVTGGRSEILLMHLEVLKGKLAENPHSVTSYDILKTAIFETLARYETENGIIAIAHNEPNRTYPSEEAAWLDIMSSQTGANLIHEFLLSASGSNVDASDPAKPSPTPDNGSQLPTQPQEPTAQSPEALPTAAPTATILESVPTQPSPEIPSVIEGLDIGQISPGNIKGIVPGYDTPVNTLYNPLDQPILITTPNNTTREEIPPAAFGIDQDYLKQFFAATTENGITKGKTADGTEVTLSNGVWSMASGETFIPFIKAEPSTDAIYLVINSNGQLQKVDITGKPIGEPQAMFQPPSKIADEAGFSKASSVAHVNLTDSGVLYMFDAQGQWLGETRFIGNGLLTQEWIAQNQPPQELITQGMETGVIRQKEDVNRLSFDVKANLNYPGEIIIFGRDPDTNEILLATRVNATSHETEWHVAGLRDFADATGMTVGSNLYSDPKSGDGLFSQSDQRKINKLVVQEFNHAIIIEVGWGVWLEKFNEGKFDFSLGDDAVRTALANRMIVEGDDLIYGGSDFDYSYLGQIEAKLKAEGLNDVQIKDRVEAIVKNHIISVMTHYKGQITEWSVLNEWRGQNNDKPDGFSRIWKNGGGTDEEFVKMVFETARAADPTARLFINDADNIARNWYGYKYNLELARFLQQNGLIDAMGLQFTDMNVASHPSESELIATMQSYNLPVIVTSATFDTRGVSGTEEEIQQKQAETVIEVMEACRKSQVCRDFRMWDAAGDKFSFLGPEAKSSIFDENMKPKLAYFALREYLQQIIDQTAQ